MNAPTCSIRYAESDSKGMGYDIEICGAVIANKIVCEGWARFTHPRGDTGEATCGVFATDAGTQSDYQKVANPDSRCVEVEKGGDYWIPSVLTEPKSMVRT